MPEKENHLLTLFHQPQVQAEQREAINGQDRGVETRTTEDSSELKPEEEEEGIRSISTVEQQQTRRYPDRPEEPTLVLGGMQRRLRSR